MKPKHILYTLAVVLALACLLHILPINNIALLAASRYLFLSIALFYVIKKPSLTAAILFCMVLGIEIGYDFPAIAKHLKVFSDIFLKLIKTIIAPLLFSTLVVGIAGHSNIKQVGRMGLKAIVYFEIVTTLALVIGLFAINISGAGYGLKTIAVADEITAKANKIIEQKQTHDVVLDIFPENIAKSIVENQVLQVVVFSILFGIALALIHDENKKRPILKFAEGLSEVMFKFTHLVMYLAPLAGGGAIAYAVATMGIESLQALFHLVATLYVALIAFILLVFVPIGLLVKLPFKKFINAISEPVSLAFATASSEAALPKALENMEAMGIPRKVVAFVLPTGYSFNLDGTTLYLSLASVFVAQACGVELTLAQQITMCLTLMLTSKGVAGVRGASFLILITTVSAMGLDPQKAFAILAIDALMDMARTSINVIGNCLATYVVAKWEKEV